MGLRFQRRVSFGGFHLNFSGSGLGLSVGSRGARWGISSTGRAYTSVGIPGSGISWRVYQGHSRGPHATWISTVVGWVLLILFLRWVLT